MTFFILLQKFAREWHTTKSLFLRYSIIFNALYRRDDLERLKTWSKRKHIRSLAVQRYYKCLHEDTQISLSELNMRFTRTYRLAQFLYYLHTHIFDSTTHFYKGSAAKYRLRN